MYYPAKKKKKKMQCREVYKSKIDTNLIALQTNSCHSIENYKRILRANNIWPGLLQVENVGYHFELENNLRKGKRREKNSKTLKGEKRQVCATVEIW